MALTTDELFDELEAQIETHGLRKLIFYADIADEETQLDICDVKYEDGCIQVTLT